MKCERPWRAKKNCFTGSELISLSLRVLLVVVFMEAFFNSLSADFLVVPLAIFFGVLVEAAFMEGEVLERGIIIVIF